MSIVKPLLIPIIAAILVGILAAAGYVVVPTCDENDRGWGCGSETTLAEGWIAEATNVATSPSGDLRVDLAIINETGEWSVMQAVESKPALLKTGDGQTTNCDSISVGTGGHYLAPGFAMRGYTTGTEAETQTQLLYVECKGTQADAGSKLYIDVRYVGGDYNYYDKTGGQTDVRLEVDLDELGADLTYPIVTPLDGLIGQSSEPITGLNDDPYPRGRRRADKVSNSSGRRSIPATIPPRFTSDLHSSSAMTASCTAFIRIRGACLPP
jgi:hypothetical protein